MYRILIYGIQQNETVSAMGNEDKGWFPVYKSRYKLPSKLGQIASTFKECGSSKCYYTGY